MLSLYLTLFNAVAAMAFIFMWWDDRRRLYLFLWGVATIMGPAVLFMTKVLATANVPTFSFYTALYSICATFTCAGTVIGAYFFRDRPLNVIWLLIWAVVCPILWWVLVSTVAFEQSRIVFNVVLAVSYLWAGKLLWTPVLIERVTAIFFMARAVAVIAGFWVRLSVDTQLESGLIFGIATAAGGLNVVLLLLVSFQRFGADLKRNIQFLGILHSITAVIHGAKTERELGEKVLEILTEQPYWNSGLLLKVTADGEHLNLIYSEGSLEEIRRTLQTEKMPLKGTLTEQVISTGKAVVMTDETINPSKLNPIARSLHELHLPYEYLHLIAPVSHRGSPIGALILTDHKARALFSQELETLTSIGEVVGFAFENIQQFNTLNYRASHDVLTGLGNRAKLHDYCQQVLAGTPFTVMLFDLDNFKEVNDVFGHAVGDKLLQGLAQRLTEALVGEATLFRLGGDEFVAVYPHTINHHEDTSAEALLAVIKKPLLINDLRLQSAAAIGVVQTTVAGNDSHELLRCADLAMYKAKHSDISIAHYDTAYDAYIKGRAELLADVKEAIQTSQFELFYQPLVGLKSGYCVACEALLRWHHPTRGLLNAAEFIPVIESTEHISTITHRVIELALQDLVRWREQGIDISVAINLSARNFLDPSLPDFLVDTARAYGVPNHLLQLEITETVLMKDPHMAEKITTQLYQEGFNIVLDDFGTGYSSLAYMDRFPISVVKIDQSFVAKIHSDKRSKNIVETIIDLTHKMGFKVTAEGVETQQTAMLLEELQCDSVQGFLYAKPMKKNEFDLWYKHNMANQA